MDRLIVSIALASSEIKRTSGLWRSLSKRLEKREIPFLGGYIALWVWDIGGGRKGRHWYIGAGQASAVLCLGARSNQERAKQTVP